MPATETIVAVLGVLALTSSLFLLWFVPHRQMKRDLERMRTALSGLQIAPSGNEDVEADIEVSRARLEGCIGNPERTAFNAAQNIHQSLLPSSKGHTHRFD